MAFGGQWTVTDLHFASSCSFEGAWQVDVRAQDLQTARTSAVHRRVPLSSALCSRKAITKLPVATWPSAAGCREAREARGRHRKVMAQIRL